MKVQIILMLLVCSLTFSENISISNTVIKQGDMAILNLPSEFNGRVSVPGVATSIKVYDTGEGSVAIIPFHYSTPKGEYVIEVEEEEGEGEVFDVSVIDGNFKKSYITVDTSMKKKRSTENVKKMVNHTSEARKTSIADKLWRGDFSSPVEERISSPFGAMRFMNDKVSGYHSGIDYPLPVGTPIKAVNSGKVALAMHLTSSGNTVIIDHGYNLFSSYSHLDRLDVEKGTLVGNGEVIGLSGNTGFTTGPHLHFTMSVGSIFINPHQLLNKRLLEE